MNNIRVMTSVVTHLHGKVGDDVTWRMVNGTIIEHYQAKDSITRVR